MMLYQLRQFGQSLISGANLSELRVKLTHELLDSAALGLNRFYAEHGYYPQSDGKYFFDSIKKYVCVQEAYVYADSVLHNGKTMPIKKPVGKAFDYRMLGNTYLGVGSREQSIMYRHLDRRSYLLYSVGENAIDEHGEGDDIAHKAERDR